MSTDEDREKFIRSYLTEEEISRLVSEARNAADTAVPTYSQFFVGACILTHANEYITGCNIENISYTQSVHAEGCAISKAISANKKNFKALAVYAKADQFDAFVPPCGECRQFLNEFVNFLPIIMVHETGNLMFEMLHEVLPLSVILGATVPIANQPSFKYDLTLFRANNWLMKDTYSVTRNEMRQLLRDWKFDEIDELTKEEIQFNNSGTLVGKFRTGNISINFNTLQKIFEAFARVEAESKEKIIVRFDKDETSTKLAHRVAATLLAYQKSVLVEHASEDNKSGEGVAFIIKVSLSGESDIKQYKVEIKDGKDTGLSKEFIDKIYEERKKLLVYRGLNEFYDYKSNTLLKKI